MSKSALLRSVASYAHLLGRPAKSGKAEEKEEDEKKGGRKGRLEDDKKDDDKKDARRAEDDSDDDLETDDSEEEKKRRREEEDEQDEQRRDDDDDDKQDRREEEDEQDRKDAEDEQDAKARGARRRERARCRAIFTSKDAASRPDMAAYLAFETSMSRKEACRTLGAVVAGQPKASGFRARMDGMEAIRPGTDGGAAPTGRQAGKSSWDSSAKRLGLGRDR